MVLSYARFYFIVPEIITNTQAGALDLTVQMTQAPGASVQYHPGRLWIEGHVHTGATCSQKSDREARLTHSRRAL